MFQKHQRRPILGEPMPIPISLCGLSTCTIHFSMPSRNSAQSYVPGHTFAASTDFTPTQTYHTSIASLILSGLHSYNTAASSFQTGTGTSTGVIRVASRLKYTQSRFHLLNLAETHISLVSSYGYNGVVEEYSKTHFRPPSHAASVGHMPDQNDYMNSLEGHQDLPTHRGPHIKIATLKLRQPPRALISPPIFAESVLHGSDIIGVSNFYGKMNIAKRHPHRSTLPSDLSFLLPLESALALVVHFHCNSISTSVPSDEKSWGSGDRHDWWLIFGQSSFSPTR